MRSDSVRVSAERTPTPGCWQRRGGGSAASYLDRRSPSGAEENAAGGVGVRSAVCSEHGRGDREEYPWTAAEVRAFQRRERERGRERKYARGGMRDRGGLIGERGVVRGGGVGTVR